jgi:hypothetical protein
MLIPMLSSKRQAAAGVGCLPFSCVCCLRGE